MKVLLPRVLAGIGGIGAVGTTIGIVYPISRSNEDGINDTIIDAKFSELKEKIKEFADKCEDKTVQYEKTILEELENILGMLLGPQEKYSGNGRSNLEIRKSYLDKRLTAEEKVLFKDLYDKMTKFSNPLRNDQKRSSKYRKQLGQK